MKKQNNLVRVEEKNVPKMSLATVAIASIVLIAGCALVYKVADKKPQIQTTKLTIKSADTKIQADGMIRSQNETVLHFATGGKLVYLPIKEGSFVRKGQTIASLDTYVLQKQLTASLNNYRSARDSFDQLSDNNADNYLDAQQANPYPYNYFNLAGMGNNDKINAVNDMVKRLADQAQAGLDNSVIQVEIANYALSLSSIQAPFDGIITHMDVTTPYVMVSSATGFTIVDPSTYVFRANVSENNINDIAENSQVNIQLTGIDNTNFQGIVSKIYPDKVTLPTGENIYQVDIASDQMAKIAKYRQDGSVLINGKYNHEVALIPSWMVLSKKYVWASVQGKPTLKEVSLGETSGDKVEVTGLSNDSIITNPESVAASHYSIL